jgi:cobalt-zinc-cadmium efflux system outer membrane protein
LKHLIFLIIISLSGISIAGGTPRGPIPTNERPDAHLTLPAALDRALDESPVLQAFNRDYLRSKALERQAGIWENPAIEIQVEDIEEADGDARETEFILSQTVPLGRDIARRRQLMAARAEVTNWDFEAARLDVVMQVSTRFIAALAADRRLELARKEHALAIETREVIRQLVEAGKASPMELTRMEVPVVNTELALARQSRLRDSAYRQLSLMWDTGAPSFTRVVGDLDPVSPPPYPDSLVRHINSNPEIARWSAAVSEQAAARRLAVAEAIPDPELRIGFRQRDEPDDEALIVGIAFPFPVFDRGQGDRIAAREAERAAQARKRAAELQVEGLLDSAYTGLANAHDEVVALRDRALPAAEKGFRAIQSAFSEGKLGLLDVLDAQRTLFEMERRHLDALVAFHLWTAELEALVGQPLEAIGGSFARHPN